MMSPVKTTKEDGVPNSRIQVASGGLVDPLEPDPDSILIEDIAHHLGNLCRFTGASTPFYSIAEHAVLVSRACDPADALWGLLHDAPEYVLGDLSTPLKHSEYGEGYRWAEEPLMETICLKFGLPLEQPESVSRADSDMLARERRLLLPRSPEGDELWAEWIDRLGADESRLPDYCTPQFFGPELARVVFLDRFMELRNV